MSDEAVLRSLISDLRVERAKRASDVLGNDDDPMRESRSLEMLRLSLILAPPELTPTVEMLLEFEKELAENDRLSRDEFADEIDAARRQELVRASWKLNEWMDGF